MQKKKVLLLVSLTTMSTVIGMTLFINKGVEESTLYERNNATTGEYTLSLDSSNHLDTEDGGVSYFSYTAQPLRNKVYFNWDDTADIETGDGCL